VQATRVSRRERFLRKPSLAKSGDTETSRPSAASFENRSTEEDPGGGIRAIGTTPLIRPWYLGSPSAGM